MKKLSNVPKGTIKRVFDLGAIQFSIIELEKIQGSMLVAKHPDGPDFFEVQYFTEESLHLPYYEAPRYETHIISKTRGVKYSLQEILKKGLKRACLFYDEIEKVELHECWYGSKDGTLNVSGLRVSDSLWTDSVSFEINGSIPYHVTKDGAFSLGFGCGVNTKDSYTGFPDHEEDEGTDWDQYQKSKYIGQIRVYNTKRGGGIDQEQVFEISDLFDIEDRELRNSVLKSLQEVLERALVEIAIQNL